MNHKKPSSLWLFDEQGEPVGLAPGGGGPAAPIIAGVVGGGLLSGLLGNLLSPKPPTPPAAPQVPTEENQKSELDAAEAAEKAKRRQRANVFTNPNLGSLVAPTQQARTVLG